MSTVLTISGVDKTALINWRSLKREQVVTKEADTLYFLIKKHSGQTYKPTAGEEVILTIAGTREFGGYITEVTEQIDGMLEYISCICKDYTHALDRNLVAQTYENQSVEDIIADLVDNYTSGFTHTNVNCPTIIEKVQFNYLPVSKCIEKLTELVGDYEWYVDYDKDVFFFASIVMASPFDITDTGGNYVFNSLHIREDTHQLRNEVIIRGGLLTSDSDRTELVSGNGNKVIFPLATKFASLPAVSISGSAVTVGLENLGAPGSWVYWDYNEKFLRFVGGTPANASDNISIVGPYKYPLILQKRDEDSILSYGLFQHIIIDKTIVDLETAGLRADVELLKYAQPLKTANFDTYEYGLKPGQTINIQSTIRGIDQDFKIQAITSRLKTPNTDELVYEVESVTAEDIGINDILTRLLIKNPSDQIDFSEDEVIVRIRSVKDSLSITDSVGTPAITTGPYLIGSTAIVGFFTIG